MTPDERPFDERFAERVRDVFDAYEEPVDEAALGRMRAALGASAPGAGRRAPDRPPVAGRTVGRARWAVPAALAVLVAAVAAGLWLAQPGAPDGPQVAAVSQAESDIENGVGVESAARVGEEAAGVPRPSAEPVGRPAPALADVASPSSAELAAAAGRVSEGPVRPPAAQPDARVPEPTAETASRAPAPPQPPDVPVAAEPAVTVAALPPAPAVLRRDRRRLDPPAPPTRRAEADAGASGVRLVVASTAAFSNGRPAEGAGVAAGVVRAWRVAPGLSVSGGAVAAYGRYVIEAEDFGAAVRRLSQADLVRSRNLTARSTVETVAVEVPVDVALDVAPAPGGRLGVSVGLTSALYLAQTFQDEGETYSGGFVASPEAEGGVAFEASPPTPFETRETVGPLGRLDLGRQLNLGVGYTPAGDAFPLAVDVYGRLPLGGVTSRDLALTVVGLRLRYALP